MNFKKTFSAFLEVNENKEFTLFTDNTNLSMIGSNKSLILKLEDKNYFLENVELKYLGNNRYALDFENDELYDSVKNHSIFKVNIVYGTKKVFEIIFNM